MIGMSLVLSRSLIWIAVSKPSMPGIWTSRRITANSSLRRSLKASSPEFAFTRFCPRGSRAASSAIRFSGRSSTMRMLALRSATVTSDFRRAQFHEVWADLFERHHTVRAHFRKGCLGHLSPDRRIGVLHDRVAGELLDPAHPVCSVLVGSGKYHSDQRAAV